MKYPRFFFTQALNAACAASKKEIDEIPEPFNNDRWYFNKSYERWPRTALQACLQPIPGSHKRYHFPWEAEIRSLESVIKLLLEHGANVNQALDGGITTLHIAAEKLSEETVQTIIAKGADIDIDIFGKGTPLQLAAGRELNALPIVRLLLESGAIVGSDEVTQQK
ncbi:uncharacterized protein N7458_003987 [Penicillium daleae]|uniref:Ankyrin repeat protein n=1 Tax=Penicillium daleae TaxID=63821 RepID=A0AAD6G5E9_9EURO|nr:uncharacterized protein N7458_003987 [Penicillium daleae]KAJ5455723.1 hypothetical protein N7458_003987 [Penicillium daleae]